MPELTDPVVSPGTIATLAQPRLTFDRYALRPWDDGDADALVAAYGDPDIQRWHARSLTIDEAHAWVASRADRWAEESGIDWAVVDDRTTGTAGGEYAGLVGRVGLRTLDLHGGLGEAAYWTVPSARGRGVSVGALQTMTTWLFEVIGLHRIDALHSTANPASCRVAEKAGYAYEATLRSLVLHADGWHDMHVHACINAAD